METAMAKLRASGKDVTLANMLPLPGVGRMTLLRAARDGIPLGDCDQWLSDHLFCLAFRLWDDEETST